MIGRMITPPLLAPKTFPRDINSEEKKYFIYIYIYMCVVYCVFTVRHRALCLLALFNSLSNIDFSQAFSLLFRLESKVVDAVDKTPNLLWPGLVSY